MLARLGANFPGAGGAMAREREGPSVDRGRALRVWWRPAKSVIGGRPHPLPKGPWDFLLMSRRDFWAWAWTALIVVVSWIPENEMGLKEEGNKTIHMFQIDKVAHVALFLGFAWLWMDAAWSRRRVAWVLGIGLLLAVVTEIGQGSALVGRDANLLDLLADLLGLILGVAAYRLLVPRFERLRVVSSRGLTAVGRSAHRP